MNHKNWRLALVAVWLATSLTLGAQSPLRGDKNFYPAPDRHAGLKGDGIFTFGARKPAKNLGFMLLGSEWQRGVQLLEAPAETVVKMIMERHYIPTPYPSMSTPYPQGDRINMRTRDSLHSIGEPTQPHHTSANAPARVCIK